MYLIAFEQKTIPGTETLPLTYLIADESNQSPTEANKLTKCVMKHQLQSPIMVTNSQLPAVVVK